MQKANKNDLDQFDADLCMLGILTATRRNDAAATTNLIQRLTQIDQSGPTTEKLLSTLPDSDAERIAVAILSPSLADDSAETESPAAREATARWAAGSGRWSMLATAAELVQPTDDDPANSVIVQRLFAESLMQVGRVHQSKLWWDHLIDQESVADFPALLRCAEAETAVGNNAPLAQQRIDAAREAAGEDAFRVALADLLDAELQIRRTQFDPARSTLGSITQTTAVDASIRARAQWLIGETYYLQQKFSDAIDAYRQVEGIAATGDGDSRWVSAALVQAGKSFEQLGRTREAALCYGNLLDRFPDSAHARLASQRMAAIEPQRHGDAPNSSQTIRR